MPLNNHVFVAGGRLYQDNPTALSPTTEQAKQGFGRPWAGGEAARSRAVASSSSANLFYDAQSTPGSSQAPNTPGADRQNSELQAKSGGFFSDYVSIELDIARTGLGDAFPLSSFADLRFQDRRSSFGKIGSRKSTSSERWQGRSRRRGRPAARSTAIWARRIQPASAVARHRCGPQHAGQLRRTTGLAD